MNKKKIVYLGITIIALVVIIFYFSGDKNNHENKNRKVSGDRIMEQTYNFSKEYLKLRYDTNKILTQASDYKNYQDWNNDMTTLLLRWKQMENHANFLDKAAESYIKSATAFNNINFINMAQAYSREEISNVFDKAPAGKKIRTLAKFLGVDAKRAYKILKNDQEMVKADAWNDAGDTFQKLESSAVLIKDGCKVAGFVGGVVISGGATGFAGATTLTQTTLVISGVDLTLEVSDDGATIALGNDNKVSGIIGKVRTITEPVASILAITDMPSNLVNKFDKFNAVMFGADQLRSVVQEGKIIGIDISSDGLIKAAAMTKDETKEWLKDKGGDKIPADAQEIFDALDKLMEEKNEVNTESKQDEIIAKDTELNSKKNDEHYGTKKGYGKNGKTYIAIVSPTEATFQEGQARMWKANITNYQAGEMEQYDCDWTFYLNDIKYKEMHKTCGFTSTLIDKPGTLRVEVKVKFYKYHYEQIPGDYTPGEEIEMKKVIENIETITTERFYEVLPTPKDNYHYNN